MSQPEDTETEKPPIFRSWSTWYWILLSALAVQVVVYYFITNAFS